MSTVPPPVRRRHRTSTAILAYVIILLSMQVFLSTVAVEAFLTDDAPLAWATAVVSVLLALGAAAFSKVLQP